MEEKPEFVVNTTMGVEELLEVAGALQRKRKLIVKSIATVCIAVLTALVLLSLYIFMINDFEGDEGFFGAVGMLFIFFCITYMIRSENKMKHIQRNTFFNNKKDYTAVTRVSFFPSCFIMDQDEEDEKSRVVVQYRRVNVLDTGGKRIIFGVKNVAMSCIKKSSRFETGDYDGLVKFIKSKVNL